MGGADRTISALTFASGHVVVIIDQLYSRRCRGDVAMTRHLRTTVNLNPTVKFLRIWESGMSFRNACALEKLK